MWLICQLTPWQDLVELFQELDDNKDGLVTFEEFLNGLRLFKEAVGDQQEQEQGKIVRFYKQSVLYSMRVVGCEFSRL